MKRLYSGVSRQREKCDGEPTDGGWGEWSTPECRYCGQRRLRTKLCNSPEPKCGGVKCPGRTWEVIRCGVTGCPELAGNLVVQQNVRLYTFCATTIDLLNKVQENV